MENEDQRKERVAAGARLKALRDLLDLTQEEIAERAGIDRTTIIHAEAGNSKFNGWRLRSGLATAFGISVADVGALIDGSIDAETAASLRKAAAEEAKALPVEATDPLPPPEPSAAEASS